MLERDEWLGLARKLDWDFSYVSESEAFPEQTSGKPWLPGEAWRNWEEPFKTTYHDYVTCQAEKDAAVYSIKETFARPRNLERLPKTWVNGLKLHAATLPLAEFAAVVGNLRAARFGRAAAWRTAAAFAALDEFRHTEIPLQIFSGLVPWDQQFDWTHKFYHTKDWVAVAARHMVDELLLLADPIELAIATNFVFETGFTNLQFIGLSALANETGDHMFEAMIKSIQTDEARHAQIGPAVLAEVVKHDKAYAQYLLDKWFWRSWLLFAVVTGFSMDYLTPVEHRTQSFKEFMNEWVVEQYLESLARYGLKRPWYWESFLEALDYYHHMIYASAYTYRATVWFDLAMPGPEEHAWLAAKYPRSWPEIAPIWRRIEERWTECDPGLDFGVHGTAIVGFCDLCQLVLCNGTPNRNAATTLTRDGQKLIFCSEPCRWLFESEPERYGGHKDIVKRVLAGEAPGNVLELITKYFGLDYATWGRDVNRGDYPWLVRKSPGQRRGDDAISRET